MKPYKIFLLLIGMVLLTFSVVSADQKPLNPSLYAYAEIVQKLPEMWDANPFEVTEMMESYPDFICNKNFEYLSCESVNNRYAEKINIYFRFDSQDEYAPLTSSRISMDTNNPEEVQQALGLFWLEGMRPLQLSGFTFFEEMINLYFSTENTLMHVYILFSAESGVQRFTAEFGVIRG